MSEERIDKLEKALSGLRTRLGELDRSRRDAHHALLYAVFACTVAGVLLALSTATWRTARDSDDFLADATTLWGMAPEGWQAAWTLIGVLTVAIGTIAVFLADVAGRATHVVFAVFCALTIVGILLICQVEPAGWFDPEDGHAGPGRWLTLLATFVLAVVHTARAGEVRR
ncbi:MAG TPA: hypothetical protein VGP26_28985 [Actinophytocola sp.]|jgi:hypothetical protein|nr:hypothetical protein [Actinophytocola sp.]